jgi:hypothetical protein
LLWLPAALPDSEVLVHIEENRSVSSRGDLSPCRPLQIKVEKSHALSRLTVYLRILGGMEPKIQNTMRYVDRPSRDLSETSHPPAACSAVLLLAVPDFESHRAHQNPRDEYECGSPSCCRSTIITLSANIPRRVLRLLHISKTWSTQKLVIKS